MLLVMIVSLYTSRVVLQVLGNEDYGTYQAVGGIVGLLVFINTALSQGTSRFLLFEMGKRDSNRLAKLFSTMLNAHVIIALIIVLLAETIGLWFVYNKLVIASDRMDAAIIVYHLSVVTAFVSITQTPYSAAIKSHERFDLYAYTSIIEVVLKLVIVYLLTISPIDKLAFYALLLCLLSVGVAMFYRVYCIRHFKETQYNFIFDKDIFKEVTSYCGWNLFSNISVALSTQGMIVLINMFFSGTIVTSISIATTVKNQAKGFVDNFRVAAIPQIVKKYAGGETEYSKHLLLETSKYSYFLFILFGLPIYLESENILSLWLGQIPDYSPIFLRIIVLTAIMELFTSCMFTTLDVVGKIREYSIIYPLILFATFPLTYFFYKIGMPPVTVSYVMLVAYMILAFIVMPVLSVRIAKYTLNDIIQLYVPCLKVTLLSVPIPALAYMYLPIDNAFLHLLIITIVSILSIGVCIWYVGLNNDVRTLIMSNVKSKLFRR